MEHTQAMPGCCFGDSPPATTGETRDVELVDRADTIGFARAGREVYLVAVPGAAGEPRNAGTTQPESGQPNGNALNRSTIHTSEPRIWLARRGRFAQGFDEGTPFLGAAA